MAPGPVSLRPSVALRFVGHDLVPLMEPAMTAEELLKLCHAYLRGAEINDQTGSRTIGRDELARQINLYLNGQTQEHLPEDYQSPD